MAEAQKVFAVLEEIDEGIFGRFIEWAYKGYYTAANFDLEASSSPLPVPSNEEECETIEWMQEPPADAPTAEEVPELPTDWDWGISKQSKKSKKAKTRQEPKNLFSTASIPSAEK